jgi:hypothetical protein
MQISRLSARLKEGQVLGGFLDDPIHSMRSSLNQGCKGGSGMQVIGKLTNKLLYGRVPEGVETEEIHLTHRLLNGPFAYRHAVSGHQNAGAVVPEAARSKTLRCGSSRNKARNCAACSSLGGAHPLTARCTKRMPSDSASLRSHSYFSRSSPRKSTTVVMPSFFNPARPLSFGCAPRKRTSLIFPA